MSKLVNIVGMGPSGLSLRDQLLPDGEIWGINYAYIYTPLNRLFVVHDWKQFAACAQKPGRRYKRWIDMIYSGEIGEVWTVKPLDVATNISNLPPAPDKEIDFVSTHDEPYTDDELKENNLERLFQSKKINVNEICKIMQSHYFTCTLQYLIGQAMVENFECINLWGVEIWAYGGDNQYGGQIPGVNAFLRAATARGIQVCMPWAEAMKISDRIFVKGQKYHGDR